MPQTAIVIDLAEYRRTRERAERPVTQPESPFGRRAPRVLTEREVAHRQLMLRQLATRPLLQFCR